MKSKLTRRDLLKGLGSLPAVSLVGCASEDEGGVDTEALALETRELLSRYKKFVILVMENRSFDHYFGHLSLPVAEGGKGRRDVDGFKSLAAHTNPDLEGNRVPIFRPMTGSRPDYAIGDIDHEWRACHLQFNAGRNDGFVRAHQADLALPPDEDGVPTSSCWGTTTGTGANTPLCGKPRDPMAFYNDKDTPVFHQLIEEYTLCDSWFSSVMGPTWPNRFYLYAGTAGGRKENKPLSGTFTHAGRHSIFGMVSARVDELADQYPELLASERDRLCVDFFSDVPLLPLMFPTGLGLSDGVDFIDFLPNFNYAHAFDSPRPGKVDSLQHLTGKIFGNRVPRGLLEALARWRRSPTFEDLCRRGKLPPVSYIEPPYQLAPADDHPPHHVVMGQAFVASIYEMLRNSPDFEHTLFIVTYDEHGSFYDHVAPPVNPYDEESDFRQLGFRVPALVIGKGVKRGFVDKTRYDHCTVLNTLGTRLDLGYANRRVEKASPIGACIASTGGSRGNLQLDKVTLSEHAVLESARYADGQKQIVERAFHGHVPFEAKRVFTDSLLATFERLGVASIGA